MSTPFTEAGDIPVNSACPVLSYHPIVVDVPGRPVGLGLKVTVPAIGERLPVILLSHGHGGSNFLASYNGYGPLATFWAAHGFAVIQPTHLDANQYGLRDGGGPDAPLFANSRIVDLKRILDGLDAVEAAVPGLAARSLDRERIAAVGHSLGGSTVCQLLGMRLGGTG